MSTSQRRALGLTRSLSSFVLLAFAFAGAAFADGRHALWEVKGQRNTVYLFGSMHLLPPGEKMPAEVIDAYADSSALVMEIDMDDLDPLAAQGTTMELGLLPTGQTLQQVIGPEASAKLDQFARELGVDALMLAQFRPWLAALTLTQFHMMKLGLNAQAGVEMQFAAKSGGDKKEIVGLETFDDQIKMLASLPQPQQVAFLMYTIADAKKAQSELNAMVEAWRTGDMAFLNAVLAKGFKEFPQLYKPLTVDRNRRWVPQIEQLLRSDKNHMVIVGALHLVGDDGVVELLRKRGYAVTQK